MVVTSTRAVTSPPALEIGFEPRHRPLPEHRLTFDPLASRAEFLHARPDHVVPPGDLSRHEAGGIWNDGRRSGD